MAREISSHEKAEQLMDLQENVPFDKVIELLDLQGDEKIIELGAQSGRLTLPLAKATKDRVMAVELDQELLEILEENARDQGLNNIDRMPSGIDYLNFPDNSFQRGLAAFAFHQTDDLDKATREIHRVINEQGKLVIVEWEQSEDEDGPPLDDRLPSEALKDKLQNTGFKVNSGSLSSNVYYIVADKVKEV
ncbi:class I SAM-dependent methyltransferase [Sediminibacillus massiliensis]|uniref:class I SAM-dependent methyltransferase n=1 Tax=Sediminibacillus massiliensis TaxID=1926277 RepID=UPI00098841E7|nr:methyltransferase domain-containing protein [Sediminibacillus massiliensis]